MGITKVCTRCGQEKLAEDFYNKQSRCKLCCRKAAREYHHKADRAITRHGISIHEYTAMVEAQEGKCAICHEIPEEPLRVDHDHLCCAGSWSCGHCIRGLLCRRCNTGLGQFCDSVELLASATTYLAGGR